MVLAVPDLALAHSDANGGRNWPRPSSVDSMKTAKKGRVPETGMHGAFDTAEYCYLPGSMVATGYPNVEI